MATLWLAGIASKISTVRPATESCSPGRTARRATARLSAGCRRSRGSRFATRITLSKMYCENAGMCACEPEYCHPEKDSTQVDYATPFLAQRGATGRGSANDMRRANAILPVCFEKPFCFIKFYRRLLASSANSLRSPFSKVTWAKSGWPTIRSIR